MIPLAERMRPLSIENYIGQQHLMGNGAVLRQSIEKDTLPSIIFWGPPGVGKTSLANLIANTLNRPFFSLSAIHAGVKDIREVIENQIHSYQLTQNGTDNQTKHKNQQVSIWQS